MTVATEFSEIQTKHRLLFKAGADGLYSIVAGRSFPFDPSRDTMKSLISDTYSRISYNRGILAQYKKALKPKKRWTLKAFEDATAARNAMNYIDDDMQLRQDLYESLTPINVGSRGDSSLAYFSDTLEDMLDDGWKPIQEAIKDKQFWDYKTEELKSDSARFEYLDYDTSDVALFNKENRKSFEAWESLCLSLKLNDENGFNEAEARGLIEKPKPKAKAKKQPEQVTVEDYIASKQVIENGDIYDVIEASDWTPREKPMIFNYVRASTSSDEQNVHTQHLPTADVEIVEYHTGRVVGRPLLRQLVADMRAGDTLTVLAADRLIRSSQEMQRLVLAITSKGGIVEMRRNGWRFQSKSPEFFGIGKKLSAVEIYQQQQSWFMLSVFSAISELETSLLDVRRAEGIEAAKRRGVYTGRKSTFDWSAFAKIYNKDLTQRQKAELMGCSVGTINSALKKIKSGEINIDDY